MIASTRISDCPRFCSPEDFSNLKAMSKVHTVKPESLMATCCSSVEVPSMFHIEVNIPDISEMQDLSVSRASLVLLRSTHPVFKVVGWSTSWPSNHSKRSKFPAGRWQLLVHVSSWKPCSTVFSSVSSGICNSIWLVNVVERKNMDTKRPKVLQFGSAMFALIFNSARSEAFLISLSSHWPFIDVHCEAAMIVLARRFSPLLLLVAVGCGVIVWRPGPAGWMRLNWAWTSAKLRPHWHEDHEANC